MSVTSVRSYTGKFGRQHARLSPTTSISDHWSGNFKGWSEDCNALLQYLIRERREVSSFLCNCLLQSNHWHWLIQFCGSLKTITLCKDCEILHQAGNKVSNALINNNSHLWAFGRNYDTSLEISDHNFFVCYVRFNLACMPKLVLYVLLYLCCPAWQLVVVVVVCQLRNKDSIIIIIISMFGTHLPCFGDFFYLLTPKRALPH